MCSFANKLPVVLQLKKKKNISKYKLKTFNIVMALYIRKGFF